MKRELGLEGDKVGADDAENEQDGIAMTAMYRQGFMDGVKSTKLIKRCGTKFF